MSTIEHKGWHPKPEGILASIEQDIDHLEQIVTDPVYVRNRSQISEKLNQLSSMAVSGLKADKMRDFLLDIAGNNEAWKGMTAEQRATLREVVK